MAKRRRVPGLSPNPMTNVILADIALRGASRIARRFTERRLLSAGMREDEADKVVENRTMVQTLASVALARVATRSAPGAILVGGGLLAKTLWDHAKGKEARREGRKQLKKRINDNQPTV